MAWFRHVVRPLMGPAGAASAAILDGAGGRSLRERDVGEAGLVLGCFSGPDGAGCPLSAAELEIAARVKWEPMSWEAAP